MSMGDGGTERTLTRITGALFVAGFVLTLIGSARWNGDFDNKDVAKALATILENRATWQWINAWMMAGLGAAAAGYVAYRETVTRPLARLAASVASGLFVVTAALGIVWLSFRFAAQVDVATEAAKGAVPAHYKALVAWADQVFYAHLVLGFFSSIALGASALLDDVFPKWFGWFSIALGVLPLVGFFAVHFTVPEVVQFPPLVGGITLLVRKRKPAA